MRSSDPEALGVWRTRLRWRLRGAWQWPTFAGATIADALLLSRLPFSGGRSNLLGSFLAAGFLNLAIVAVLAPLGGAALRRRRSQLPREIAADQAGTAALLALTALLLVGGLVHRPDVEAANARGAVALEAARRFAGHRAPADYLPLRGEDTWQPGPDVFRTCFAGSDPRRDFCVVVRTDEPTPIVRRDPDQRPNETIAGADNPGRRRG